MFLFMFLFLLYVSVYVSTESLIFMHEKDPTGRFDDSTPTSHALLSLYVFVSVSDSDSDSVSVSVICSFYVYDYVPVWMFLCFLFDA